MAIEKISGHGGFWAIKDAGPDGGDARFEVGDYDLEVEVEPWEYRSGGAPGGFTEMLTVLKRVRSATFTTPDRYDPDPEDSGYASDFYSNPIVLGLTEGAEVTVWLRRGRVAQYDKLVSAVVQNVAVQNPQTATRRLRITLAGGQLVRNAPPPDLREDE